MKHLFAPAVLMSSLALSACAPGALGVDIARDLPAQTIPGDPAAHAAAALGEIPATVVSAESDSPAIDGSVSSGLYLRAAALTIDTTADPAGTSSCWDFVQRVDVYIESANPSAGLPRVQIAQAAAPGCVQTMDLAPVPDLNLKPYTDQGFRVITEATGVPPDHNVTFTTHLVLRAAVLS
jgi:hypothetical protein